MYDDDTLAAELEAAAEAGTLVTHEWGEGCEWGLWHIGPCDWDDDEEWS